LVLLLNGATMQDFSDYEKRINDIMAELRSELLTLMADKLLSSTNLAKAIGVNWITIHRFLVLGMPIKVVTMAKVQEFLEKNR
jgi:hypothetical protein